MKLDTEFYRLPLRFDAARLAEEVLQFDEAEWRAHPQGHVGNTAIPLISVNGGMNDEVRGPMKPTAFLERCPYLQQVFAAFGTVIGRARLMRIAGESDATAHVDASYYWRHHVRVHVPAVTYPAVQFLCADKAVHMAAGEAWIFDSWKLHNVLNPVTTPRIHVVADTVGNEHFWNALVANADRPVDGAGTKGAAPTFIPFIAGQSVSLPLETRNFPVVMTPWEQAALANRMFDDVESEFRNDAKALREQTRLLNLEWHGLWSQFGDEPMGWKLFEETLGSYNRQIEQWRHRLPLVNGMDLVEALRQAIVLPALTPALKAPSASAPEPEAEVPVESPAPLRMNAAAVPEEAKCNPVPIKALQRPVFIVAAPRSGSTMLFELLARSPGFVTIGGESHGVIEGIKALMPDARGFESNVLTKEDATPAVIDLLHQRFHARLQSRDGGADESADVRLLEKTPKNALRISFLRAAFPDARFIFLYREPEENISSILEAWRSERFVTYPQLPGWKGAAWSLALFPGWRELKDKPLGQIATAQWAEINRRVLDDLAKLPPEDWCAVTYAEVVADPLGVAARLCEFANVACPEEIEGPLPLSRYTLTPPSPGKWRKNAMEIARHFPIAESVAEQARAVIAGKAAAAKAAASTEKQLTSVHTSNLPGLLLELGISLLVTTYQAGRLIIVREQEGALNTHFRTFSGPMGLAYDGVRLAIGTKREVWQFVNQVDVSRRLEPANTHDAAFLPRSCLFTGDIRIHEMDYVGTELWAVNTRFSCLCSFDDEHSFVPRWRPPFISGLSPDDRCHLNGMAVVDDAVKYVTCLGISDVKGGWRDNKAKGGCILEVPSGEVIASGLSMPHSPRLYGGHLWVLESGHGALSRVNLKTGELKEIARMPGFTRGIDFFGPYAFVGLSQVRETAVFSGLPLTERLPETERICGIWVIDLRNGQTVAFLRFESGVQEIFAVKVLTEIRRPDVITDDDEILGSSFVIPEESLALVPPDLVGRSVAGELVNT